MKTPTKIVILGAGYAGMMAALRLSGKTRKLYTEITLINGVDTFVERPRLHHTATGQTVPQKTIREMLRGTHVQFRQGWVTALDPDTRTVTVQTQEDFRSFDHEHSSASAHQTWEVSIPYDILVYALGSVVDQYTVPGVRENAYVLDPRGANASGALHEKLQTLSGRVVVVGGGATGIEGATEIKGWFPDLKVSLVTDGKFGAFKGPRVERHFREAFAQQDITIYEGQRARAVQAGKLVLASGETIPFDLCLWASGFRALPLAREAGFKVEDKGQILVDPFGRALSHPDVYAIGDASHPVEEPGNPMRMSLLPPSRGARTPPTTSPPSCAGRRSPPSVSPIMGRVSQWGRTTPSVSRVTPMTSRAALSCAEKPPSSCVTFSSLFSYIFWNSNGVFPAFTTSSARVATPRPNRRRNASRFPVRRYHKPKGRAYHKGHEGTPSYSFVVLRALRGEISIMNEFDQYRRLLFSIAYRMTGSAMDAEDIVQEAYIRYQAVDRAEIENPKAYLTTITTRLALNHLASTRVQRETHLGPWLPEPVLGSDQAMLASPSHRARDFDSISMAFMVLLENLTPAERAVFILREVFDYPYDEIAGMLEKSEAACRKLYSRAKTYFAANRPRFKAKPSEHQRLLEQFHTATTSGDLGGLTNLLTKEATLWADGGGKVRGAATRPAHGREAVARFLMAAAARFTPVGASTSIAEVNGLPALLVRDGAGAPAFVASIEVRDGKIDKIWATANPDKLKRI